MRARRLRDDPADVVHGAAAPARRLARRGAAGLQSEAETDLDRVSAQPASVAEGARVRRLDRGGVRVDAGAGGRGELAGEAAGGDAGCAARSGGGVVAARADACGCVKSDVAVIASQILAE